MNEMAVVLMKNSQCLKWGQDFICNICREPKEIIVPPGDSLQHRSSLPQLVITQSPLSRFQGIFQCFYFTFLSPSSLDSQPEFGF